MMKRFLVSIPFIIAFSSSVILAGNDYFGEYDGTVQTEWLDEGRKMKLLSDFKFIDPNGMIWLAKKDSEIDGASIPSFAWTFIGSPFVGKYRNASVIHDIACVKKERTWESVHLAFYYAMRASGVSPLKAKIMYAAVYHGGPRWPMEKKVKVMTGPTEGKCAGMQPDTQGKCGGDMKCASTGSGDPQRYIIKTIEPPPKSLNQEGIEALISTQASL